MANETNKLSFDGVDYLLEDHRISSIVDAIYPVGSIYMSVNNANPGTLFGGTWEQIKGRFLLGTGDCEQNTDTTFGEIQMPGQWSAPVGSTGGEEFHRLSVTEMPMHNHPPYYDGADWGIAEYRNVPNKSGIWSGPIQTGDGLMLGAVSDGTTYIALRSSTGNSGGGALHNNMPPYLGVYMWKRTA